jgi:putative ABC transport system ATP-binding protein
VKKVTMDIIRTKSLSKDYSMGKVKVNALIDIDLCIRQGEFVAIMGPSGSGKSTLMHIIGCLDRPSSGEYYLDDVLVSNMPKSALAAVRNKKIGFIFQSSAPPEYIKERRASPYVWWI